MRLHVLLSAGGVRLAIPAELVLRIDARVDRGRSLGELLGLPLAAPGAAVEVSSLAEPLLVDALPAVVETTRSAPLRLPAASRAARAIFDRALILEGEVFLELDPGRLVDSGDEAAGRTSAIAGDLFSNPPPVPDRALVFTAGGSRFAAPFGQVLGVVEAPRLFPVPGAPPAHRGVIRHGGALVAVLDLPAVLGEGTGTPAHECRFAVLIEAGAGPVGLLAEGPGAVVAGLAAAEGEAAEFGTWLVDPAGGRVLLPRHDLLPGERGTC